MNSLKPTPMRVAIVGASTLKGEELKSVLRDRKFPIKKLALLDSDEDLGRLSEFDGEPVVSLTISASSFEFLDVAFFAGSAEATRTHASLAAKNGFLLVDLTHAFPSEASVPFYLEGLWDAKKDVPRQGRVSSPHPAAITVASVLRRLNESYEIHNPVVSIFEPASERGARGVEELKQQTIDIFSFQTTQKSVFDRQLAFNLLPRFGAEARERLIESERVVSCHLRALLEPACPQPCVTLIQAPVFHSHGFSFFVEVDPAIPLAELENCLQSGSLAVIPTDDEPPSQVDVAGTDFIQIGGMKRDFLNPRGLWFWAVSDNLRLVALNAVTAAEAILFQRKPE